MGCAELAIALRAGTETSYAWLCAVWEITGEESNRHGGHGGLQGERAYLQVEVRSESSHCGVSLD